MHKQESFGSFLSHSQYGKSSIACESSELCSDEENPQLFFPTPSQEGTNQPNKKKKKKYKLTEIGSGGEVPEAVPTHGFLNCIEEEN